MINKRTSPDHIENWECVYETGTPYEAEMVKNSLQNMEIPCQIQSKRDSSFNVNFGDLALIYVYVPSEFADQAREMIDEFEPPAYENGDEEE
jgi:hypothetical protein